MNQQFQFAPSFEYMQQSNTNAEISSSVQFGKTRRDQYEKACRIRFEDLAKLFHVPAKDATFQLGICSTAFKKVCRKVGISRWPYRRYRSIVSTLDALRNILSHTIGNAEKYKLVMEIRNMEFRLNTLLSTGNNAVVGRNSYSNDADGMQRRYSSGDMENINESLFNRSSNNLDLISLAVAVERPTSQCQVQLARLPSFRSLKNHSRLHPHQRPRLRAVTLPDAKSFRDHSSTCHRVSIANLLNA